MENKIILFKDINDENKHLVGGKGENLGKLLVNGFSVPNGFCVSTEVFRESCLKKIPSELFKKLDCSNLENLDELTLACQKIREFILNYGDDEDLELLISGALNSIGSEKSYAVRSSATAEDMPTMSFAGQQDTYLGVLGVKNIAIHIIKCWASLYTNRAVIYRKKNNIDEQDVLMAVVIQEQIESEKSGIMFTANPLTNNYEEIIIDAGFGLGEALVSGLITPDMYKWDKLEQNIKERIHSKKVMSVKTSETGGTEQIVLDKEQQEKPVLSDDEIRELTRVGTEIDMFYGIPQDIEWGIDCKGDLYILQSRPITSLYPRVKDVGTSTVHTSFNHIQVMTAPITPMGIAIIKMVLPFGMDEKTKYSKYISSAGGRVYLDFTGLMELPTRKIGLKLLENVDYLISDGNKKYCEIYKLKKKIPNMKTLHNVFKEIKPIGKRMRYNFKTEKNQNVKSEIEEFIQITCKEYDKKINSEMELSRKLSLIKEHLSTSFKILGSEIIVNIGPGIISYKLMQNMLVKYDIEIGVADKLVAGLEGNITSEMGIEVYNIADAIRGDEKAIRILSDNPGKAHKLLLEEGTDEISCLVKDFINKHGMRGASEIDIASPRYKEDFSPISSSILNYIKEHEKGEHIENQRSLINSSNNAIGEIIDVLKDKNASKKDLMKMGNYIKNIKTYMPMREHGKYSLMNLLDITNEVLISCGKELENKVIIDNWRDVYYLEIDELIYALERDETLLNLVSTRKEEQRTYQSLTPPRVIAGTGEILKGTYSDRNIPKGAEIGIGVSSGVVEGYARVILDPRENTLKKGEILVTKFTDPGWTPLFVNAKGLVLEVGGIMTHGAIVAREYGIPGVVGVEFALENIKTGDYIRVNGDEGYVEIIKE